MRYLFTFTVVFALVVVIGLKINAVREEGYQLGYAQGLARCPQSPVVQVGI